MGSVQVGSITISTELDNTELEKELGRLKKKILREEESFGRIRFKKNDLEQQLQAANEALETLRERGKILDGKLLFDPGDIDRISELQTKIPKIEADIRECEKSLHNANRELEYSRIRYGEIAAAAEKLPESTADTQEAVSSIDRKAEAYERQSQILGRLKAELQATGELASMIGGSIKEKLSPAFESVYQRMKPVLDRIRGRIGRAFQPLRDKVGPDMAYARESVQIGLDAIRNAIRSKLLPDIQYASEHAAMGVKAIGEGLKSIPGKIGNLFAKKEGLEPPVASVLGGIVPKLNKAIASTGKTSAAFQKLKDTASKAGKSVGSSFAGAGKAIGILGKSIFSTLKRSAALYKNMNIFSKLSDSLSKKFKRLGSVIKSALVFSVIYKGLSLVRQQMGSYLSVNTQFMTALRRLQGVLLTAFQPIYDIVVPALTTLINILSRAVATITQFFASLFGTTAKQAQINAKNLYEQANATEAAGAAAEEASKQMASFDEINKLEGNKSASGGGGASSSDTGPLFDYAYEETPFKTWGEAFDAFLDQLLGGIPKLRDAFKNFADWLNNLTKNLYEMFTFPRVLEKVKQLGRELAEALNDLVSEIDWYQMGQALGAGLNLALNFLTSFLYAFDWINLGKKLAEFVNGLVSEIDWYEFGRLLWAGFKIGLETLAGFLLGLDMPLLAEAASSIVIGFFDEMKNTINKIPWGEIGRQIARFLTNINWNGIFQSVYDAFNAALDALADFIIGFLDEIGEQLDMHGITDPLIELVQTVHDFIQQIVEDTRNWISSLDFGPLSAAFQSLLEAISPLVSTISEGLLWAYENVLLPLASWVIEDAAPASVDALTKALEAANEILKIVIDVIKALYEAMRPVFEWIGKAAVKIIESLGSIFEKVSGVFQKHGPQIQRIIGKIGDAVSAMWTIVEPILNLLMDLVGVVFEFWGDVVSENIGYVLDELEGLIDFVTGVFSGDWELAWKGIQQALITPIRAILDWIGDLVDAIGRAAKAVGDFLSGASRAERTGSFGSSGRGGSFGGSRIAAASMPDITDFNIPALAKGAVIPPNREFLAVLGDQRSGTNIEAPTSAIENAVANGIRMAGSLGGGNRPITVILQVDRRELGRVVYEVNNEETQRVGVRLTEVHT